jgi:hypothetical protein
MKAFNITVEHMQRWADSATAAEVTQARREVEAAIASMESAPERFPFLDREYSHGEVTAWLRAVENALAKVKRHASPGATLGDST